MLGLRMGMEAEALGRCPKVLDKRFDGNAGCARDREKAIDCRRDLSVDPVGNRGLADLYGCRKLSLRHFCAIEKFLE